MKSLTVVHVTGSTERPYEDRCFSWPPALLVGGMARIVGWDHGADAGAGDEGPAAEGFEVVVRVAERFELVESGVAGGAVFVAVDVVVFEAGAPFVSCS